jgi:DNA-binding MurR/RpiR family transcriptional regulator
MEKNPLEETILAAFDGMSAQLQAAARYILDHPRDIALLSMREQARQAGLQPATMTRLAKHLGFDGYEDIRSLYRAAVRGDAPNFAGRVSEQAQHQKLKGDQSLAGEMLMTFGRQAASLAEPDSLARIADISARISAAREVYCLGLRSSHAPAWHLHYILSLIGKRSTLLDGIGGTGTDPIGRAGPEDVLVAVSVLPYTRATIEIADYARERGIRVVAITDSPVAPLAQSADMALIVRTDSPSFFHSMIPAFAAAEIVGALVAGHGGDETLSALSEFDERLAALGTHLTSRNIRKTP